LHAHSPCRWLAWSWKTGCNVPRSCLLPIMSPLCGCPAAGRSSSGLTLNHAWLLLPATTCAEKLQQLLWGELAESQGMPVLPHLHVKRR
jgi:hypothetical protein